MARPHAIEITEPLTLLEDLEDRLEGSPLAVRVRVLRLLKEEPARTATEIAELAESSERSVQRWISQYRRKGLAGMIGSAIAKTDPAADVPLWQKTLKSRINTGKLSKVGMVREWLEEHAGMRCSMSETQFIIRHKLGLQPEWIDDEASPSERLRNPGTPMHSNDVVRFLTALPTSIDTEEWIIRFWEAFERILPGVDRVVGIIRTTCRIMNPDDAPVQQKFIYTYHTSSDPAFDKSTLSVPGDKEERHGEQLLQQLLREKRPLHEFHPPYIVDYYFEGKTYLGTLMFFCNKTAHPLKDSTIELIDALEPFVIYTMSNHVAWVQRSKLGENPYHQAIEMMTSQAGLTPNEQRIAIHMMANNSLATIAHDLNVSIETIRSHVRVIHHKTRTRNRGDLLTKYLSPFVVIELPED